MYKITLINSQTNQPHQVNGCVIEMYSRTLDRDVEQLMRNRDPSQFRLVIERA
jgi:hypothetical protein